MRIWSFSRAALGICAAEKLAGCGGSQPPIRYTGNGCTDLATRWRSISRVEKRNDQRADRHQLVAGMKISTPSRRVLRICAVAAMLAGCGGSQVPIVANVVSAGTRAPSRQRTFYYTGGKQTFDVPTGVAQVTIVAKGAAGSDGGPDSQYSAGNGGGGGYAEATIPVTPGESLAIFVGGSGMRGGFNGGEGRKGIACRRRCFGFGGGASDVRQGGDRLADRVVVAAGGGGGAGDGCTGMPSCYITDGGKGGDGGGDIGGSGSSGYGRLAGSGGAGGMQSAGGKGGAGGGHGGVCRGSNGRLGAGGAGHFGCPDGGFGGGGGGGYYGGGGGGGGRVGRFSQYGAGGGGGGGSSFVESSATHVRMMAVAHKSDALITISW